MCATESEITNNLGNEVKFEWNLKLSFAVRGVVDLFVNAGFFSYLPCEEDTSDVRIGDIVVFQNDGNQPVSSGVLCVATVQNVVKNRRSENELFKTLYFCKVFEISVEDRCFRARNTELTIVPYEHLRVKLLESIVVSEDLMYVKNFESLPPLKLFN